MKVVYVISESATEKCWLIKSIHTKVCPSQERKIDKLGVIKKFSLDRKFDYHHEDGAKKTCSWSSVDKKSKRDTGSLNTME